VVDGSSMEDMFSGAIVAVAVRTTQAHGDFVIVAARRAAAMEKMRL